VIQTGSMTHSSLHSHAPTHGLERVNIPV
jgi:hypothetical protein